MVKLASGTSCLETGHIRACTIEALHESCEFLQNSCSSTSYTTASRFKYIICRTDSFSQLMRTVSYFNFTGLLHWIWACYISRSVARNDIIYWWWWWWRWWWWRWWHDVCISPSEGACCASDCQLVSRHIAYVCRQETSCQTASVCEYPLNN